MTRLTPAFALVSLLCGLLFWGPVAARDTSPRFLNAKRLEAVKRWEPAARGRNRVRGTRHDTDGTTPLRVKNITFTNPEASSVYATVCVSRLVSNTLLEFYVDGTSIPLVNFDVGPSWSGLIPISSSPNETRKVWLYDGPPRMSSAWSYLYCSCSSGSSLLVQKEA
jgi:carboxypeptidase D